MSALSAQESFSSDASGLPRPMPPEAVTTEVRTCLREARRRMELVNVAVAKEDYEKLKALGEFNSDYIGMALSHYVHITKNTTFRRDPESLGWSRGPVITFPCAISKDLLDEVRNLPGRIDEHAIEAVRLLFRDDVPRSCPDPVSPKSRLRSALSRGLLFATYAGLVFFASRILRLVDNLSLVNR